LIHKIGIKKKKFIYTRGK